MQRKTIAGFSKLSKKAKLQWVAEHFFAEPDAAVHEWMRFWLADEKLQQIIDHFSENTLSNFVLPFSVAPNFVINDKPYAVPMVIEESSVVAAASNAAKYWMQRGGFRAQILSTVKLGQVHFYWKGNPAHLQELFPGLKEKLLLDAAPLTVNMEQRGGGILDVQLVDFTGEEPGYFQLKASFETCDSMGANFINSVLESFSGTLVRFFKESPGLAAEEQELNIVMSILSNYTPECVVRTWVECDVEALGSSEGLSAAEFADKFYKAVRIAHLDPYRATTHNKGIFNGIDAVVIATGNDFRAIEACGHTYAARDGQYRSLSHCSLENGRFKFWMDIPLAVGTVGGLTKLHPLSRNALELLGHPGAAELMAVIAATGLAQNFAAVKSLVTTGIQQGHMRMHLANILHHYHATDSEIRQANEYFRDKTVSNAAVREFLSHTRKEDALSVPVPKNGERKA